MAKLKATMEYEGRTVACPILKEGELSHPLEEYFPRNNPERWFAWEEQEQNTWIRRRLEGACAIFGYPNVQEGEVIEAHHIVRKGHGGKDIARVPWNMIPALKSFDPERSAHDLYHTFNLSGTGFEVVHWDWLDEKNGFEVLDEKNKPIPHEKLYFYTRATDSRVETGLEWTRMMLSANKERVKALYALAVLMAAGDTHAHMLGYEGVEDWMAQHGMMIALAKQGAKLFDSLHEHWDRLEAGLIPIQMADLVRRKTKKELPEVKEDWIEKVLDYCSPLAEQPSIADFITLITIAFPLKAQEKKATLVTGDNIHLEPKKVKDYGLLFGQGIVIKGWPIGVDEAEE